MTTTQRRSLLWTAYCEHTAVLPWLREVLRLAQAAEEGRTYRRTLERQTELMEMRDAPGSSPGQALVAELWALDPAWAMSVLGPWGIYLRRE